MEAVFNKKQKAKKASFSQAPSSAASCRRRRCLVYLCEKIQRAPVGVSGGSPEKSVRASSYRFPSTDNAAAKNLSVSQSNRPCSVCIEEIPGNATKVVVVLKWEFLRMLNRIKIWGQQTMTDEPTLLERSGVATASKERQWTNGSSNSTSFNRLLSVQIPCQEMKVAGAASGTTGTMTASY